MSANSRAKADELRNQRLELLSLTSSMKPPVLPRYARRQGFRSAIETVTQKQSKGVFNAGIKYESAVWANNVLKDIWQVEAGEVSRKMRCGSSLPYH